MWKKWSVSLLVGLAVGIATVLGQKYLPDSLNNFANSGAIWLIPAFGLSYFWKPDRRSSILISILTLFGCVAGYYLFEAIVNAHAVTLNKWTAVWATMSLVGGPVCGLAAHLGNDGKGTWKSIGLNLLPAALLAETLDKFLHFQDYAHLLTTMLVSILLSLLLYFAIHRKESVRIRNAAALVILTALGVAFFEIFQLVFSH